MQYLLDFIDRCYCINLDSRPERWDLACSQFKKVGIQGYVQRVPGVVHSDPRVGCLKAHFNCVQDAIDNKYENILIFEDDVFFTKFDDVIFPEVTKFLENNRRWDLFYLGGNVMYPANFLHKHVFRSRFFSTHAYIINQRAYSKALNATIPIDKWYALNMVSYGLYPYIATQSETYSDIRQIQMRNLEQSFDRKYEKLVAAHPVMRWAHYIYTHYIKK